MSFDILKADLQGKMPGAIEARRPVLNTPMDDAVVKLSGGRAIALATPGANEAKLLVPMETNPAACGWPELIPVLEWRGGRCGCHEAKTLAERWRRGVAGSCGNGFAGVFSRRNAAAATEPVDRTGHEDGGADVQDCAGDGRWQ